MHEGSPYRLTPRCAVVDPGTDTVASYIVHWGDGRSQLHGDPAAATAGADDYQHHPDGAVGTHDPVDLVDGDGTYTRRSVSGRQQRGPDDRHQRRRERQRGLALQPDPGRGHRPGHRHRLAATSSTGATATPTPTPRGAKTHTYADGPDNYNMTVDLVDEDGTFLDRPTP